MLLVYVDESGDTGLVNSPTRFFVLSALVLHEVRWLQTLDQIVDFRRQLKARYSIKLREEVHASDLLHSPGALQRIPKSIRLRLLRDVLDFEAGLADVSIVNIVVDKDGKPPGYPVFESAWRALVQRIETTISFKNFPGPFNAQEYFLLLVDQTDEKALRLLTRKSRRFNPVPSRFAGGQTRNLPIRLLVEDACHRDSRHSYFIQLCDANAYFLAQRLKPCGYVRRQGATNYFNRLGPVLCRKASSTDPDGIVRL